MKLKDYWKKLLKFLKRLMSRKINRIIGLIELGLLPFLPNYAPSSTLQPVEQTPSALERIVESQDAENQRDFNSSSNYVINSANGYAERSYRRNLIEYIQKHINNKEDMTNRVPLKWLNILPENIMGGVLGFTYLGENFMGRRADLTGWMARMVDIHESIHTPDEYETRVLTSWIMEKARSKYIK